MDCQHQVLLGKALCEADELREENARLSQRVQELEGLIVALVPPPPPERARAVMRALIREATALAPAEVKP